EWSDQVRRFVTRRSRLRGVEVERLGLECEAFVVDVNKPAVAQKTRHFFRCGMTPKMVGLVDLLDSAVRHDCDAIGNSERLIVVMSDKRGGSTSGIQYSSQLIFQPFTQIAA